MKKVCLSLLLLGAVAQAASASVKDGVDAWSAGDYDKAVAQWKAPAAAGDADAQFNLAQAYKLGRGVPTDLRIAEGWYRKAAEQGHDQAQATLGLIMFQNGDRKGALPWLQKAAERGEPRAQYVYGTALFNGDLAPKDWPRAYALMTRAAAAGLPQAKSSLAQMDQFIPVSERQKGTQLAATLAAAPSRPPAETTASRSSASAKPAATAPGFKPAPMTAAAAAPAQVTTPVPAPAPSGPPPVKTASAAPEAKPAAPKPAPAKPAAAKPAPVATDSAGSGWRVQLGAYKDEAAARTAWSGLKGKAGLAALTPTFQKAGAVTRLRAGPFASRTAAAKACAAVGSACFPVAP